MAPRPRLRRKGAMETSKKRHTPLFFKQSRPLLLAAGGFAMGPLRLFPLGGVQLVGQPRVSIRQKNRAAKLEPMLEGQVL